MADCASDYSGAAMQQSLALVEQRLSPCEIVDCKTVTVTIKGCKLSSYVIRDTCRFCANTRALAQAAPRARPRDQIMGQETCEP